MSERNFGTVSELYRYPVKGLSAQPLSSAKLEVGKTIPYDRAWAIENGPGRFDPDAPRHLPKISFVMLMRNERLAALEARFDESTKMLTILHKGSEVVHGSLASAGGRETIELFLSGYMLAEGLRGPPKIVSARNHSFSDVAAKCVHIISRTSLTELEEVAGRPLDPIRFRPNIIVDGWEPWAEFSAIGQVLEIGSLKLKAFKRTQRCAATNVNPDTAERDTEIPDLLAKTWGHTDFGVYAKVVETGTIRLGDRVELARE